MSNANDKPASPVIPVQLGLDDPFRFHCHKGIARFNKCCENIDILLTSYDIVRLKNRFGITSREFINRYTVDFQMDGHGMPGLKLRTKENATACINLTPEGCSVYGDWPAACRYYALGMVSMRRKESARRDRGRIEFPVRREGALHQRVQVPPEELSMHLGSYRARSRYQSDRGSRSPETEGL